MYLIINNKEKILINDFACFEENTYYIRIKTINNIEYFIDKSFQLIRNGENENLLQNFHLYIINKYFNNEIELIFIKEEVV